MREFRRRDADGCDRDGCAPQKSLMIRVGFKSRRFILAWTALNWYGAQT